MATLVWPDDLRPTTFKMYLASNGSSFKSPWNGATQTVGFPGSAWEVNMELSNQDDYEARAIEAILFELDGMSGRILLRDYGRTPPPVKGRPVVYGAGQTGIYLATAGWTPSTKVLSKGDYITVNNELKYVLEDCYSVADGRATIKFAPKLRNTPASNAEIEVARPYGIFRLTDNKNGVDRKSGINNDFSLSFTEVF